MARLGTAFLCCAAWHAAIARADSITELGAKADGRTLNTAAIQQAIDQAAADGGGRVSIPPGMFKTGALTMLVGIGRDPDGQAAPRTPPSGQELGGRLGTGWAAGLPLLMYTITDDYQVRVPGTPENEQ